MQILLFFMFVFVAEAFILTYGLRSVSRSPTSPSPRDRSPLRSRLLVVLLVGLFSGGWVVVPLLMSPGPAQYTALLFLAIPVLGGLWVGTVWHGKHLKSYVVLGLVAGILATLVSAAIAAYIRVSFFPVGVTLGESETFFGTWWQIIQVFTYNPIVVFSTTMLFIAGGLIGDRIEWRAAESGGYRVPT